MGIRPESSNMSKRCKNSIDMLEAAFQMPKVAPPNPTAVLNRFPPQSTGKLNTGDVRKVFSKLTPGLNVRLINPADTAYFASTRWYQLASRTKPFSNRQPTPTWQPGCQVPGPRNWLVSRATSLDPMNWPGLSPSPKAVPIEPSRSKRPRTATT